MPNDPPIDTMMFLQSMHAVDNEPIYQHEVKVAALSYEIALILGETEETAQEIRTGAGYHDVGRFVQDDVLHSKADPLNAQEKEDLKNHCLDGARMLIKAGKQKDGTEVAVALCHHERWDGSGYPAGLKGEEIPLAARIVALADFYDALRSKRPYKDAIDHERTMRILVEGDERTSPSHFDPAILNAFVEHQERLRQIWEAA